MTPADLPDTAGASMPVSVPLTELRVHLHAVSNDLERLTLLLGEAATQLLSGFAAAHARLDAAPVIPGPGPLVDLTRSVRADLQDAMSALQFQDLASQLVDHSVRRIRAVADILDAPDGDPKLSWASARMIGKNCPVAQLGMSAGTVVLF